MSTLASPLSSCVTLFKSPNLSETLSFIICKEGAYIAICLVG